MIIKKCRYMDPGSLSKKGVSRILECFINDVIIHDVTGAHDVARGVWSDVFDYQANIVFSDNEAIGERYIVYSFRVYKEGYCGSIRIVVEDNLAFLSIITLDEKCRLRPRFSMEETEEVEWKYPPALLVKAHGAPGQKYISNLIIYRILGQPSINLNKWRLLVDGLISNKLELSYEYLLSLPMKVVIEDFHCVTGWSVSKVSWKGIPTMEISKLAMPLPDANWVYIETLDGYTTIIPVDEFLRMSSLIALYINNKVLPPEHGFPARLVFPHLYGWKSAKWLSKIIFLDKYIDGYWEKLGYHQRGLVHLEERFKHL